jgi:hypothetical protein
MQRRQLIRQRLARASGSDSKAAAEIAAQTWREMVSQIVPIIGDEGVRALYVRAVHLTKSAFPWLDGAPKLDSNQPPFAEVYPRLKELRSVEIAELTSALLITFTELLATLIGDDLTSRLTSPAWADDGASSGAKRKEREK